MATEAFVRSSRNSGPNRSADGYVHKFRLEVRELAACEIDRSVAGSSASIGWLVTKLVASSLALSVLLIVAAGILGG